ncbi:MAG: hypothetical protein WA704_29275, partial [Pseudolabrys sp.]
TCGFASDRWLAPQLKRKAVNRPNAEANLLGNLHDACSLPKLGTGAFKAAGSLSGRPSVLPFATAPQHHI